MSQNMDEMTDLIRIIRPVRVSRRRAAGVRCGVCGLGIIAADYAVAVIVENGEETMPRSIHKQCGSILIEMAQAAGEE